MLVEPVTRDQKFDREVHRRWQRFALLVSQDAATFEPKPFRKFCLCHLELSAREAVARGFIPMTSGSGTGVTAPFEKIERLRKAIGPAAPLAMSGVHPPHADRLVPLVTHFLVATCISRDFYTFDEAMLQYLIGKTAGASVVA